ALRGRELQIPISIDTYKAGVAERALLAGAEIVNDVSGLRFDGRLASVAARHKAGFILMHMRGTPRTMQQLPVVKKIIPEVRRGLSAAMDRACQAGVSKRRIIIDPGIGFGKSVRQSLELLGGLQMLDSLGCPILAGPSRKSFIQRILFGEVMRAAPKENSA